MSRILLAWEFGGELGHVRRAIAVARQLRDRGHEVALAFANLAPLGSANADGFEGFQAPHLVAPEAPDPSPLNASDILLNLGFGDAAALTGALRAWLGMFRLWQPHALVADYAPTAMLAARATGLKRFTLGSGFSAPPAGQPMPALRSWIATDPAILAERDARLVACVRRAFDRLAPRPAAPQQASEIFAADAHLVCAWPELDPFGPRDAVEYLGPQAGEQPGPAITWRQSARPRIFAYLKADDPRFGALLAAIASVAGEAIVVAPALSPAEASLRSSAQVRVLAHPVNLGAALREADLAVGHAGAGLVAAATAHGVPMGLLPLHLEQYLIASRVTAAGHAQMLSSDAPMPDLAAWLAEILGRADLRTAAGAARAATSRPAQNAAARIERALEG